MPLDFDVNAAVAEAMADVNAGNVPPDTGSPPPAAPPAAPPAQQQNPPPPATAPPQQTPPAPDPNAVERQRYETDRQTWQREKAELAQWAEYQKFATQNPAWREHLQETWARRQEIAQTPLDPNDPVQARVAQLEGMLAKQSQTLQQFEQHQAEERVKADDANYQGGLKAFKEQHPELNLDERDPQTGKTREFAALEYAKQHRIEHLPIQDILRLALHGEILARTEEKARATVATKTQEQRRQGIVPQPTQPQAPRELAPRKGGSYGDAAEYVIQGLGLAD